MAAMGPICQPSNLISCTHCGPVGAFSTSFAGWGSTQRGKGMVCIWVNAIVGATRNWLIMHVALRLDGLRHAKFLATPRWPSATQAPCSAPPNSSRDASTRDFGRPFLCARSAGPIVQMETNALTGPVAPLQPTLHTASSVRAISPLPAWPKFSIACARPESPATIIGSGPLSKSPGHAAEPDGPQARTRTRFSASGFDRRLNRRALVV
jgi:hypothetical protein